MRWRMSGLLGSSIAVYFLSSSADGKKTLKSLIFGRSSRVESSLPPSSFLLHAAPANLILILASSCREHSRISRCRRYGKCINMDALLATWSGAC